MDVKLSFLVINIVQKEFALKALYEVYTENGNPEIPVSEEAKKLGKLPKNKAEYCL